MKRRIVFLVGASGVGKTAVASLLESRPPWSGCTHFCDSIGVPSRKEMVREKGSLEGWQEWITSEWIERLSREEHPIQLFEGQTRPSFIRKALERQPDVEPVIILLDCRPEVRQHRLAQFRGQPDLANPDMDKWAAYLSGQADALGLAVIDTSDVGLEEVAARVAEVGLDGFSAVRSQSE